MENNILASGTYITAKGSMLIAKLVAAQTELTFTRAAVGTGKTPEGIMPDVLTNLNAYKMDAEISDYGIEGDKAYVNVQVSSQNVTEGFLVTEVGIFANDPDEGEILYAYMDISSDPTYMYANGSSNMAKFAEFMMYIVIGSVQKVTAIITPGSFVNRQELEKQLEPILNPEFDDSGEVDGITSQETFGETIKSKMSLFDFFRNFKAGLKFMLGLGSIVNNGTTTIAGKFVLDAIQANPNVAGTLAATLKQAQTDISSLNAKFTVRNVSSLEEITQTGFYMSTHIWDVDWATFLAVLQNDKTGFAIGFCNSINGSPQKLLTAICVTGKWETGYIN